MYEGFTERRKTGREPSSAAVFDPDIVEREAAEIV